MIIITGGFTARPDSLDQLRAMAVEHTLRSRSEPGCISHDVSIDANNPLHLMFIERWADMASIKMHFAVPASNDFVREARKLATGVEMSIYDASEVPRPRA